MGKTLYALKPRLNNLSKNFGTVRISNFAKQCITFLLLYIYFVLMHQIIGFKIHLWISACLVTVVAERVITHFTKKHHQNGDIQTKSELHAPSSSNDSMKRPILRAKKSPLMASWGSVLEESSQRDSLIEHEEKAPFIKSFWDRIGSTKGTTERDSQPFTAPKDYSPFSNTKTDRSAPLLSAFRDLSPSQLSGVSDDREIGNAQNIVDLEKRDSFENGLPAITTTHEGFKTYLQTHRFKDEKHSRYSATLPLFFKSTSTKTLPSIASVSVHSDPTDDQASGPHLAKMKPMDENKIETLIRGKRSQSRRRLSCFFCCGGDNQFQLPQE